MPPVVRRVLAFPVAYAMITGDRRAAHGNGQHPRPVGMRKIAVEIRPSCDGTRRGQSSSGTERCLIKEPGGPRISTSLGTHRGLAPISEAYLSMGASTRLA